MYDKQFTIVCFPVFAGKQKLLIVNIYNQFTKTKLLEIIRVKENYCIFKVDKENRTCFWIRKDRKDMALLRGKGKKEVILS